MAVIINEFEILPEPPPQPRPPERSDNAAHKIELRPEDIMAVYARERVRVERVRAD